MKFFVDTADLTQISHIQNHFTLDGVTTNPTLVAQHIKNIDDQIRLFQQICEQVEGPVSAEVMAIDVDGMLAEARRLAGIHERIVVKLPLIQEGLIVAKKLKEEGISTNITLCFSALQALLAARAGATMVSIFVGRLDDMGMNGMEIVDQTVQIFNQYHLETKILVASVRHVTHILEASQIGADIVTIPPDLFPKMINNPLTDKGLEQFLKSYHRANQ